MGCQRDRSVADDGKRISLSLKDYLPLTCPSGIREEINSCPFDSKAFNEAFEEFAQYLTKGKKK